MRAFLFLAVALAIATASASAQSPKPLKLPEGVTAESLADKKEATRIAAWLEKEYPAPQPEGVKMLAAILRGSQLDGSDGWFGPAASRYTWDWLLKQCGADAKAKGISRDKFKGSAKVFDTLDRDGDGQITRSDLDWSDRNPYVMQGYMLNRIFRRMDRSGDGQLTREELEAFFKQVARDGDTFTADDFRRTLIPRGPRGFSPGDGPSVPVLVRGLFAGEIGSISEGPKVGAAAPPFKLKTADGKDTVELSKLIGPKPVVLVFGNFTCGPFRGMFPDVDAVRKRFEDRATFVMVYVREAHPTDGWSMQSNTRFGVKTKQPTTYEERVGVCEEFRKMVKPGMKIVVDDITDPAGTAYSGMPARLYVIDTRGKVAYKSGRGPFGFKPGEMEQALAMALVEAGEKE